MTTRMLATSARGLPAVDDEQRAGHVRRRLGGEVDERGTELGRVADAPERDAADDLRTDVRVVDAGHIASRDLAIDPSGAMPENCPAVWIIDGPETPTGGELYEVCDRELLLVGFVRKSTQFPDSPATQCNRLVGILDQLWTLFKVDGLDGQINFRANGARQGFVGDTEGVVQFPVIVRYAREG